MPSTGAPGTPSRQCSTSTISSPTSAEIQLEQQVVDLVDRSGGAVLDRQRRRARRSLRCTASSVCAERSVGLQLHRPADTAEVLARRLMAIGALGALETDHQFRRASLGASEASPAAAAPSRRGSRDRAGGRSPGPAPTFAIGDAMVQGAPPRDSRRATGRCRLDLAATISRASRARSPSAFRITLSMSSRACRRSAMFRVLIGRFLQKRKPPPQRGAGAAV